MLPVGRIFSGTATWGWVGILGSGATRLGRESGAGARLSLVLDDLFHTPQSGAFSPARWFSFLSVASISVGWVTWSCELWMVQFARSRIVCWDFRSLSRLRTSCSSADKAGQGTFSIPPSTSSRVLVHRTFGHCGQASLVIRNGLLLGPAICLAFGLTISKDTALARLYVWAWVMPLMQCVPSPSMSLSPKSRALNTNLTIRYARFR